MQYVNRPNQQSKYQTKLNWGYDENHLGVSEKQQVDRVLKENWKNRQDAYIANSNLLFSAYKPDVYRCSNPQLLISCHKNKKVFLSCSSANGERAKKKLGNLRESQQPALTTLLCQLECSMMAAETSTLTSSREIRTDGRSSKAINDKSD